MPTTKLTVVALFVAIGVASAHLVFIPIGVAKCFPVQHCINILLAVLLGTRYTVSAAFITSLLRLLLGTGSLLAFPGSMIGALLAGIAYRYRPSIISAIIGELIGTGILGALLAFPLAKFILGSTAGALFFIPPFAISAGGGTILAWLLYKTPIFEQLSAKFRKPPTQILNNARHRQ